VLNGLMISLSSLQTWVKDLKDDLQQELRISYNEKCIWLSAKIKEKTEQLSAIGKQKMIDARTELINLWQGSTSPIKTIETE